MKTNLLWPCLFATAFLPAFSLGCGSSSELSPSVGQPLLLDDVLAYVDASAGAVILVDPTGTSGPRHDQSLRRMDLGCPLAGGSSIPNARAPERHRLTILSPSTEELLLLDDKAGEPTRVPIGLPFDALDVSVSGRWAVAYQPDDLPPQKSLIAFPNALAVVDLAAEQPAATALRLASAGTRPRKVVFAEELLLAPPAGAASDAGAARVALALVFVEGGLVPLDLVHARPGSLLPLSLEDELVLPAEVLFAANQGDASQGRVDEVEHAYVRGTNGQLYVLAITLSAEPDPAPVVTLENVVTPDTLVSDIELYFAPDGRELLLAAAGDALILVDGGTGVAERMSTPARVDTLLRFEESETGRALALGFASAPEGDKVLRLDPLALAKRRSSGIETLDFASAVADLRVAAGAGRALVTYNDATTLGILDLGRDGEVLDVQMASRPQAQALGRDGSRLLVVTYSSADHAAHLAEITLAGTPSLREVRLEAGASVVGEAGDFVFVDHGDATGSVTFFPANDLRREQGIAFRSIAFTELLQSEQPREAGSEP